MINTDVIIDEHLCSIKYNAIYILDRMKVEILSKNDNQLVQHQIITKIKNLINEKHLEPGDKLPSERMLAETFEVSRGNLRQAIQKLEFYGLLKSMPQSGTYVANIGIIALNGMIDDIISLGIPNFKALVETRILLELKNVRWAAERRTNADLVQMKAAMDAHAYKVNNGLDGVQEDLLFHLAVAKACGNGMMNTFMLMITPEIITNFEKYHVCDENQAKMAVQEHQAVYQAIEQQNPELAETAMKTHFKLLYEYCEAIENKNNN